MTIRDPMAQTASYFRIYSFYVFILSIITTAVVGAEIQYGPSGSGRYLVQFSIFLINLAVGYPV
jgi:hypothetical protein